MINGPFVCVGDPMLLPFRGVIDIIGRGVGVSDQVGLWVRSHWLGRGGGGGGGGLIHEKMKSKGLI